MYEHLSSLNIQIMFTFAEFMANFPFMYIVSMYNRYHRTQDIKRANNDVILKY